MGFGLAVSTLVGNSLGEQKSEDARKYTYVSYAMSALVQVMTNALQGA